MPDVIAQVTLKAGGVYHPPGSVVAIPTQEEADDLVARGFVEHAGEADEAPEAEEGSEDSEGSKDSEGSETDETGEAEEGEEEEGGQEAETSPFPDSLPGADALRAAGIEAIADVPRSLDELVAIEGIGAATARKILAELEA